MQHTILENREYNKIFVVLYFERRISVARVIICRSITKQVVIKQNMVIPLAQPVKVPDYGT